MAAHSVGILLELASDLPFAYRDRAVRCSMFLHSLDYAPGMDELDLVDWRALQYGLQALRDSPTTGVTAIGGPLRDLAVRVLGLQIAQWEQLGRPSCHEEWVRAKYPEESDGGD